MKDDLFFQPGDVFLVLLDDLRLKVGLSITGNIQVDLPELGFDGLGREAVSGVVVGGLSLLVVFFVAQMVGQLTYSRRFTQFFLHSRAWIADYEDAPRRPTLRLLEQMLRTHHGFRRSYDALRRYVRKRFPEFWKKGLCDMGKMDGMIKRKWTEKSSKIPMKIAGQDPVGYPAGCEVDPMICSKCGGRMKVVAFLTEYAVVDRIIDHLKLTMDWGGKVNAGRENSAPRAGIQHAVEKGNA